jgi:hypothetical protein
VGEGEGEGEGEGQCGCEKPQETHGKVSLLSISLNNGRRQDRQGRQAIIHTLWMLPDSRPILDIGFPDR